ncbi:MAG: hypothetical protein GEU78_14300 [Actinobacteria bacterium]|nr:hypothetical protein [Actinomycetota bacterium]
MSASEIYRRLGVRPVINAAGNFTRLGGSMPSERTLVAMAEASQHFVVIEELQRAVHARLAQVTSNEAAHVSAGAAAGLYLVTAAIVSRHCGKPIQELHWEEVHSTRVVVHAGCRCPYDWAVRQIGVDLVEAGDTDSPPEAGLQAMEAALDSSTAALLYVPAGWNAPGTPPFEQVAALARGHRVPLVVDAAAQIPPSSNLWGYTGAGAEVAVFSGGKGLRAPQSTGLVVGKEALMEWVDRLGFPHYGFGRMLKVGREEMIGLLNAVEELLAREDSDRLRWCEAQVQLIVDAFRGNDLIEVGRGFPNIAGQPLPYAAVHPRDRSIDPEWLVEALRTGDPSIAVGEIPGCSGYSDGFIVNTLALSEGEMPVVISSLERIIATQ